MPSTLSSWYVYVYETKHFKSLLSHNLSVLMHYLLPQILCVVGFVYDFICLWCFCCCFALIFLFTYASSVPQHWGLSSLIIFRGVNYSICPMSLFYNYMPRGNSFINIDTALEVAIACVMFYVLLTKYKRARSTKCYLRGESEISNYNNDDNNNNNDHYYYHYYHYHYHYYHYHHFRKPSL